MSKLEGLATLVGDLCAFAGIIYVAYSVACLSLSGIVDGAIAFAIGIALMMGSLVVGIHH